MPSLPEQSEVLFLDGSEGDATEDFGESGAAEGDEFFVGGLGGVGVGDVVDDGYEVVSVCSDVSCTADGGGDAVEDDVAEDINRAGDVAYAVGCWRPGKVGGGVVAGGVVLDGVGSAEVESTLQGVGEAPGLGGGVEDPLLNACSSLRGGVGVEGRVTGELIAFVSDVEGIRVGEPEAEGSGRGGQVLCQRGGGSGEDAHVRGQAGCGIK